jgi:hypothetical protein
VEPWFICKDNLIQDINTNLDELLEPLIVEYPFVFVDQAPCESKIQMLSAPPKTAIVQFSLLAVYNFYE